MSLLPQIVIFTLVAFWPVMMIRNSWVYRTRIRWIREDYARFDRAMGYHAMMVRFWDWRSDVSHWVRHG